MHYMTIKRHLLLVTTEDKPICKYMCILMEWDCNTGQKSDKVYLFLARNVTISRVD